MLRACVLSLLILGSIIATIPFSASLAYWRQPAASQRTGQRFQRHSRAWWRRYRARLRRRRALAAQRRRMLDVQRGQLTVGTGANPQPSAPSYQAHASSAIVRDPRFPFSLTLPTSWSRTASPLRGEMKFNIHTMEGQPVGMAVLSPFTASSMPLTSTMRLKKLGSTPLVSLRHTVIDRMIAEGGWVVNELEREVGGRRVFVVLAQSGGTGVPLQSWVFYFTEINGRIYSLTTIAPLEFAAMLAADSEQVLTSFGVSGVGTAAAPLR